MALTVEMESQIYHSLRTVFGAVAHLVSLGFTIVMVVLTRPGSSLFSWHPFLMSLANKYTMTATHQWGFLIGAHKKFILGEGALSLRSKK